jgi:hypothetical protein
MAKRIPDHLKVLSGTARADRMNPNARPTNCGLAEPPEWLNERAVEIFQSLGVILLGMGVASPIARRRRRCWPHGWKKSRL